MMADQKRPRYLTKSRFKLAMECPTKLFYTGKSQYVNQKKDDPFLEALADGGFQVGELAKHYYPGGHDITTLDYEDTEQQTLHLMKHDDVVIFEAAIRYQNLFIRVDILEKSGNTVNLIEVKAKSYNPLEKNPFLTKQGTISSEWKPYLYDIAFQTHVVQLAYPDFAVKPYLLLVNKKATVLTDGLNQRLRIKRAENRRGLEVVSQLTEEDLKKKILEWVPVNKYVETIFEGNAEKVPPERSFVEEVNYLAKHYQEDIKIRTDIGSKCGNCEFQCSPEQEKQGAINGLKECWKECVGWEDKDFDSATVLEIHNFKHKDRLINAGKIKLADVSEADIAPKPHAKPGLSQSQRQWLQVQKSQNGDNSFYLDMEGLKQEMSQWKFPLHFIDFETAAPALPFNQERSPYEGVAFQFSHHTVDENGNVEHAGEFLNVKPGVFPNHEFVRELQNQLRKDDGTIFCYSHHENTYLNKIHRQLTKEGSGVQGLDEILGFIESITYLKEGNKIVREGNRRMVDMCDLVKKYYYDPYTKGSNSIKYVLPAIIKSSKFLQEKYSKPVYGSVGGIKSLNFPNKIWIERNGGEIADPYSLLGPLIDPETDDQVERLYGDDELKNGGAAMTAFAYLQFTDMSAIEREQLEKALLRYCELDTLAMVMIYEAWSDFLRTKRKLNIM